MQLIIPMSGIGKRFREKGYKLPKPFIQISGKSIIEHVIKMFPGVEDILFIVNRDHYEDPALNLKEKLLRFAPTAQIAVIAPHKLGPAWAISQAKDFVKLDDPVVINYCDFACIWDFPAFREMLHSGLDGLIATYSGFHRSLTSTASITNHAWTARFSRSTPRESLQPPDAHPAKFTPCFAPRVTKLP